MGKVNIAIIDVGNCASSLIQGIYYYRNTQKTEPVPGLMHINLGGYHISDNEACRMTEDYIKGTIQSKKETNS